MINIALLISVVDINIIKNIIKTINMITLITLTSLLLNAIFSVVIIELALKLNGYTMFGWLKRLIGSSKVVEKE